MIEIDKDLGTPIYTPEAARKLGWSEADIERVFGKQEKKSLGQELIEFGQRLLSLGNSPGETENGSS